MYKSILFVLFLMSFSAFASEDYAMVKKALGYDGKYASAFIGMEVIHSKYVGNNFYALVYIQEYTNGACNPRGTCGCGTSESYVSLTINKVKKEKSEKKINVSSCSRRYDSKFSEHGHITAFKIDDINESCESKNRLSGVSLYLYDKDSPEKGIQNISPEKYEEITNESAKDKKIDDISKDKCFYVDHDLVSDKWGGRYDSSLVYETNRGEDRNFRRGKFIGYKRKGVFLTKEQTDQTPIEVNERFDSLYNKESAHLRKKKLKELKILALKSYKSKNYEMAQVIFSYINSSVERYSNLSIMNDLALTLYKQKKYDASESWSEDVISHKGKDNYNKYAASAYYNLGLIYEAKNDTKKALSKYKKSNELHNTKSATKAIERLE